MSLAPLKGVQKVEFRLATKEDNHLPWFDNTKLSAINTCPTWGILRYVHKKRMQASGRAMALEAGAACHEAFAAVRLYDLGYEQGLTEHFNYHGVRLFGVDRFTAMTAWLDKEDDKRTRRLNYVLESLYTSGFYDDPSDKRRTMTNLEEALIAYCDRWPVGKYPVWVRDEANAQSDIGIEVPFNVVITFTLEDNTQHHYRFVGKIDGIHTHGSKPTIHENKTASRLDDAWRESFYMSHQVTGYCLAASLFTESHVDEAFIHGCAIPQPRSYDYGGIVREYVTRPSHMFTQWVNWFWHTVQIYEQYKANVFNAPKYTHSCNRYFRPCSFIPFCASDPEEQELIYEQMVEEEWDPLAETKGDD